MSFVFSPLRAKSATLILDAFSRGTKVLYKKIRIKRWGGGPIYQAWSNVNPVRVKEPLKGDEKKKKIIII